MGCAVRAYLSDADTAGPEDQVQRRSRRGGPASCRSTGRRVGFPSMPSMTMPYESRTERTAG